MSNKNTRYLKLKPEHVSQTEVPLVKIITETHPGLPPLLLQSLSGIISSLIPRMTQDPDQVKMLLRGGTFRNYYFGNTIYDNAFHAIWDINSKNKTEEGLVGAVIQHLLGPMDIDIRLNEKDVEICENRAIRYQDEEIPKIIDAFLNKTKWQKTSIPTTHGVLFERQQGEYLVQIVSISIGKTQKRPLHNVVFKRLSDETTVLELSMADLARTETEKKEDIRYHNDGLSADNILVGEILQNNNTLDIEDQLLVRGFFQEKENDWEQIAFHIAVSSGRVGPNDRYLLQFAESAIESARAITWLISHWSSSLRYFGEDSIDSILKNIAFVHEKPLYVAKSQTERTQIRKQLGAVANRQKEEMQDLLVPLLSDHLFLVSANPYLGILLSYAYGLLDTMNLGKIINSEERLMEFLGNIAKKTGFSQDKAWKKYDLLTLVDWYFAACLDGKTDPLVLLDALKSLDIRGQEAKELHQIGLHPNNVPKTIESLLLYLLPIGLSFN